MIIYINNFFYKDKYIFKTVCIQRSRRRQVDLERTDLSLEKLPPPVKVPSNADENRFIDRLFNLILTFSYIILVKLG
jgi:hypothetical protein